LGFKILQKNFIFTKHESPFGSMMKEDVSLYDRFDIPITFHFVWSVKPLGVPVKNLTICAKLHILPVVLILSSAIVFNMSTRGSETLYEMVPHVVLPQTIQYKPMATSLSQPGTYTAYTNAPATYTAFPSYVLPYPTEMRSIQQAVYPVIPVARHPEPIVFPQQEFQAQQGTIAQGTILIVATPINQEPKEEGEPKPGETRPVPALPRAIQKTIPYRDIDVYSEEKQESGIMQMDFTSSIESFLSRKNGTYSLVQWSNPINPYLANTGPFAPYTTPYGFAMNSGTNPPYANLYPQVNNPTGTPSQVPGISQEVLNQIEQLLQKNPNMQFSAVMMGANGQLIPLGGVQQPGSPASQQAPSPEQQMQQLQTQMQYIQAMNQYVRQLNDARANPYCVPLSAYPGGYGQYGGYAPYVQPIPGNPGAYALANPYALAMYQSLYGGYGQQPMNPMNSPGYGPMFNPYLPTPQGYYGTMPDQKEKSFRERMRERRKKTEQSLSDAWKAPHYPEETGMRMPAKNAYPWGYFGGQVAPQETPNFGGYYGMYVGNSTYPGL